MTATHRPASLPAGITANLDICDRLDAMTDSQMAAYLRQLNQHHDAAAVAAQREHTAKVRAKMAEAMAAYGYGATR